MRPCVGALWVPCFSHADLWCVSSCMQAAASMHACMRATGEQASGRICKHARAHVLRASVCVDGWMCAWMELPWAFVPGASKRTRAYRYEYGPWTRCRPSLIDLHTDGMFDGMRNGMFDRLYNPKPFVRACVCMHVRGTTSHTANCLGLRQWQYLELQNSTGINVVMALYSYGPWSSKIVLASM